MYLYRFNFQFYCHRHQTTTPRHIPSIQSFKFLSVAVFLSAVWVSKLTTKVNYSFSEGWGKGSGNSKQHEKKVNRRSFLSCDKSAQPSSRLIIIITQTYDFMAVRRSDGFFNVESHWTLDVSRHNWLCVKMSCELLRSFNPISIAAAQVLWVCSIMKFSHMGEQWVEINAIV